MSKKILVVEDETSLREAYVLLLEMQGWMVEQATNGQEALNKLEHFSPDIIVLDLLMPIMSGIQFLEVANERGIIPTDDFKILVLSNLSDDKSLKEVVRLGATQHKLKSSLSPAELLKVLKTL